MDNLIEDPDLRGKTGVFPGRPEAGTMLAGRLRDLIEPDGILLAIPSGGVPVACAIVREILYAFQLRRHVKDAHPAFLFSP